MILEYPRKKYFTLLLVLLGTISVYCILRIIFQRNIPKLNLDFIKSATIIYMIIYQSLQVSKRLRIIIICTIVFFIISYAFMVMHWPLGFEGVCLSFGISIIVLAIDFIRNIKLKLIDLILLTFPIVRFIQFIVTLRNNSLQNTLWNIELITTTLLSIILACYLLFPKKELSGFK